MTIEEMEYDVKSKLNRVDSNAFRGLTIPEIDWKLNQAHDLYLNRILSKNDNALGFEKNERLTSDISPLVTTKTITPVNGTVTLPADYRNFVSASLDVQKNECTLTHRLWVVQHDDLSNSDFFSKPSFEWEETNGLFRDNKIYLQVDGTPKDVELTYVKNHKYIHNAVGYNENGYKSPSGVLYTGKQDSQLAPKCHAEIVDIAVALIAQELGTATKEFLKQKINY